MSGWWAEPISFFKFCLPVLHWHCLRTGHDLYVSSNADGIGHRLCSGYCGMPPRCSTPRSNHLFTHHLASLAADSCQLSSTWGLALGWREQVSQVLHPVTEWSRRPKVQPAHMPPPYFALASSEASIEAELQFDVSLPAVILRALCTKLPACTLPCWSLIPGQPNPPQTLKSYGAGLSLIPSTH